MVTQLFLDLAFKLGCFFPGLELPQPLAQEELGCMGFLEPKSPTPSSDLPTPCLLQEPSPPGEEFPSLSGAKPQPQVRLPGHPSP